MGCGKCRSPFKTYEPVFSLIRTLARVISFGFAPSVTHSLVMMHLRKSLLEGALYITSFIISSIMERSPLAPVLREIAFSAIASIAASSNSSLTPSISRSFSYCFTSAFLGSVSILTSASRSKLSSVTVTDSLPTNSGISPNLSKSCGCILPRSLPVSLCFLEATSAPKPRAFLPMRCSMIFSSPSKAPPQIKSTFVVSICINSWCGCFLPPCGGTEATVPSRILSSAC